MTDAAGVSSVSIGDAPRARSTGNGKVEGSRSAVSQQEPAGRTATETGQVVLTVPADSIYLSVVRTAAAGLGARLDFTLDDIEDLRIAVDEACALLLKQARPGSTLTVDFSLAAAALRVTVTATCDTPRLPSRDGFSWTVLSALTSTLDMWLDGARLVIMLGRARGGGDA